MSRHGAFADYLILPAENLHPVPDAVLGCRRIHRAARRGARDSEQVPIGLRDRVLVVGDGKLGQLVAQTLALTGRAVRPRGTLVLKSTYAGVLTLDASAVVVQELTLVGSRCGPFAPALRLLEEQRGAVEPLIQARYALRDGLVAFEQAQRPGVLKVLLEMDDGPSSRGSEVVRTA